MLGVQIDDNNFRFIFAPIKKEPPPGTPAQPSTLDTVVRKNFLHNMVTVLYASATDQTSKGCHYSSSSAIR